MSNWRSLRAFTVVEAVGGCAAFAVVIALTLPMLGGIRSSSLVEESLNNLTILGYAHATYAADWNGRQVTYVVDDFGSYGDFDTDALAGYELVHGHHHPSFMLGWGPIPPDGFGLLGYWIESATSPYAWAIEPINFNPGFTVGSCRIWNARPLHDYVNGRCQDPLFYAPADNVQYPIVEPFFDRPWETHHAVLAGIPAWPTYMASPAAQFHPDVMRSKAHGGYQDPFSIDHGFTTPGLFDARYPGLKTQLTEHFWLQNQPANPCNPVFVGGTFDGCEPWYFNHGIDSAPATLFYDLSVRLLSTAEAVASDQKIMRQTGFGLWSRDTPMGEDGYFGEFSYDGTNTSYHVFTTDGILGRDTIAE